MIGTPVDKFSTYGPTPPLPPGIEGGGGKYIPIPPPEGIVGGGGIYGPPPPPGNVNGGSSKP